MAFRADKLGMALALALSLGLGLLPAAQTASAAKRAPVAEDYFDDSYAEEEAGVLMAQEYDAQIAPSEAAAIAQDTIPGSRALKVKLLPSGVYAVTLKVKGSVVRVMVDAQDGSIR